MKTKGLAFTGIALMAVLLQGAMAVVPPKNMRMGTNFWVIAWGGDQARSGSGWNPTFLEEIKPYTCLRFMDWQGINASGVTSWAGRGARDGITYQMMVDLCNRNNSDAWFCIPHAADDTFPRELAKLLKASLKPGLKAYIEYSNETWNTANPFIVQTGYAAKRALALGIAPSWAVGDQWIHQAAAYHAYRICQIGRIFQEVFGAEMASRVRLVAASHAANTAITGTLIECLQDSKINPHDVKMDAFAIAPYFGAERNGADITAAMTYARAVRIGGHLGRVQTHYNAVVGAHARVIGYEGGQHFTQNADVFAKNPGAYEVYMAFLDAIAPYIDLFCHYAHCGKWSSGGAWGAKQYTGQPISQAHKYRALVAWAQQNPYQEPSETVSTVPLEQPLVPTGGIRATHSGSAGVAVSAMDLAGRLLSGRQIIVRQTKNNGLVVLRSAAAVPYVMPECPAGIRVNER